MRALTLSVGLLLSLTGCVVIDSPWGDGRPGSGSGEWTVGASGDTGEEADEDAGPGVVLEEDTDGASLGATYGSCLEILEAGAAAGDGLYSIDPGGLGALEVWCDMTTDGGGWTLIQRTVWEWIESYQLDTDYAAWRSEDVGEATPGRAFRLSGDRWQALNARGEHLIAHTLRDAADGGDCETLRYAGEEGWFSIDDQGAALTPIASNVEIASSEQLSTAEQGPASWCADQPRYGIPWFYDECCHTCPAFKNDYWTDEAHPMVNYVDTTPDLSGALSADVCPSGAALPNENGGPYRGANAMEYFLR